MTELARTREPQAPHAETRRGARRAELSLPPWVAWASARSGWLGPLAVAVFAGVLRFYRLGTPHAFVFDETYYPKDAWSLLHLGYEGTWPNNANDQILAGPQKIPLGSAPEFIAHPPLGKWVISVGEGLFGLNPFGWRFMTALLGTLAVLMLCRIGRRLFRSTLIGCTAGLLMSVDGLAVVMSRTSLLDGILMFWVLAAFGCLLVDRDKVRERTAAGLRAGWRPWRIAAGVLLGCACSTKWTGAYVAAFFGVMAVLWDVARRRRDGSRHPYADTLKRDVAPAFGSLAVLPALVYVASWTGWFATGGGWDRQWAVGRGGATWIPGALRGWWHYQWQMYVFNTTLSSPHTYQSNPWSWLVMARPVSMYWQPVNRGKGGCTAASGCTTDILALGTPLLWWTACAALGYLLWRWVFRRDWRSGAVLCGVAAGYLPWFMYQNRTIFSFYMVIIVPFLCLAVAQLLGAILGPPGSSPHRRLVGGLWAGGILLAIMACFLYYWPIYTAQLISMTAWNGHMWWPTWI